MSAHDFVLVKGDDGKYRARCRHCEMWLTRRERNLSESTESPCREAPEKEEVERLRAALDAALDGDKALKEE